jgi:hypothetical protein
MVVREQQTQLQAPRLLDQVVVVGVPMWVIRLVAAVRVGARLEHQTQAFQLRLLQTRVVERVDAEETEAA